MEHHDGSEDCPQRDRDPAFDRCLCRKLKPGRIDGEGHREQDVM
jgi:hypothetical protein